MAPEASTSFLPPPAEHRPHLIPAWMVPLLSLPLRRIWDKPGHLVLPLIQPGSRVLEVGPGSGYFTFPMAQALGEEGRIICVELQDKVRRRLSNAIARRALAPRIEVRSCAVNDLHVQDLAGSMDLAVAIDVLHEIGDPASAIQQMASTLRPGGRLLIREPKGHCPASVFKAEIAWALQVGLVRLSDPPGLTAHGQVAVFQKD